MKPENKHSAVQVITIEDPLVDPYKITQAVRGEVSQGRRITTVHAQPETNDGPRAVILYSAPAHDKHGLGDMEIPNQTRPHRAFDSLQPAEGPIDGKNRT